MWQFHSQWKSITVDNVYRFRWLISIYVKRFGMAMNYVKRWWVMLISWNQTVKWSYRSIKLQGCTQIENGSNESWIKHNASLRKVCEKLNKHILEYVHPVFSLRRSPTKQVITSSVQHQSSLKAVVSLNCMSLK